MDNGGENVTAARLAAIMERVKMCRGFVPTERLLEILRECRELLLKSRGRTGQRHEAEGAADAVSWAFLQAKLDQIYSNGRMSVDAGGLLSGGSLWSGSGIPQSVLDGVPHLRDLKVDPYQQQSMKYRQVFNISEDVRDAIINLVRLVRLRQPLPRSVWKDIILEEYVDFEELYAEVGKCESAIVKKNNWLNRRPIVTEAEWIRVFEAWKAGVIIIYDHRAEELQNYKDVVLDLFHSASSLPLLAIQFDADVRLRHSRSAFRTDSRKEYNALLWRHMIQVAAAASQMSLERGTKRYLPAPSPVSQKRRDVPCQNWNIGKCKYPCVNRRKHGVCCVCGEQHQAKDHEECLEALYEQL